MLRISDLNLLFWFIFERGLVNSTDSYVAPHVSQSCPRLSTTRRASPFHVPVWKKSSTVPVDLEELRR